MIQAIKKLTFKFYKLVNHLPFNNTVKGKVSIENDGAVLWRCKITSSGIGNRLILMGGVFLHCEFVFLGNDNIIDLGKNCIAINASFYTEDNNNTIISGDNTRYAGKIHIAVTESKTCIIGNDCLFSSEIVIRTGDSHSILNEAGIRINQAQDVVIGNHVWVGHRVLITKGVEIPENCVVGTGAIVTKKIDKSGAVIAGVPARIVKENINWDGKRF